MDLKKVKQEKVVRVQVNYDDYESDEWTSINVIYRNGETVHVERLEIEAFLRVGKIYEDLQQVQKLRDDLVKIFGTTGQFVPVDSKPGQ